MRTARRSVNIQNVVQANDTQIGRFHSLEFIELKTSVMLIR